MFTCWGIAAGRSNPARRCAAMGDTALGACRRAGAWEGAVKVLATGLNAGRGEEVGVSGSTRKVST